MKFNGTMPSHSFNTNKKLGTCDSLDRSQREKDQNILADNRVVVNDLWLVEDMKINKCDLSIQQT